MSTGVSQRYEFKNTYCIRPAAQPRVPVFKDHRVVDHGRVIRCNELTDYEWELLDPLIPRAATGRPRVPDRQVINGMVYKIRTGISWRDLPERYGPWQTVSPASAATPLTACSLKPCSRSRLARMRPAMSTGWCRSTPRSSAPTSTPPRRGEKGDLPTGRTGRSRPRPIPRRTDHQDPPGLRRPWLSPRDPADTRPTPRQHLCTAPRGAHPRLAHRRRTTALQARPGHRGQALQFPRLPHLPAPTRHRPDHPGEDRPAAPSTQARPSWRPATGIRPADVPPTQPHRTLLQPLKFFRGIATRYDKTATSYEAAVILASFLLWARSV